VSIVAVLLRNISWNYLQAGVSGIVYLLLTPLIVAQLGTIGFGLWVLLNAILFYLKFLDLGFYNSLVKYVAEYAARKDWVIMNGLIAVTGGALTIAGLCALAGSCLVAWWLVPSVFNVPPEQVGELQLATLLIGANLLIAFPTSALNAVLEGRQRFDVLSAISIPITLAAALATVLVLRAGQGVLGLVWITIGATGLNALACWVTLRRLYPEIRPGLGSLSRKDVAQYWRHIRGYSTWTSLNEILAEGSSQLEKLLIPILLSVALLTPYALIVTVCAAVFLLIEPITDAFFPLSSAYDAATDRSRLSLLLSRGTKLVVGVSLPLAVGIGYYGRDFILLWIGTADLEIPAGVLPLVVASFAVTAFILTGTTILLAMARVREVFWMGISELALAIALVVLTVPRLGLLGLAGSLLIANVLITFAWIVPHVCRLLDQSVRGFLATSILRPALAIVPMALLMVALEGVHPAVSLWRMVLNCALSGALYLVSFWVLSLTSAERAAVYASASAVWPGMARMRVSSR
jgi:O-antigen/teichoic acid export membrane protein